MRAVIALALKLTKDNALIGCRTALRGLVQSKQPSSNSHCIELNLRTCGRSTIQQILSWSSDQLHKNNGRREWTPRTWKQPLLPLPIRWQALRIRLRGDGCNTTCRESNRYRARCPWCCVCLRLLIISEGRLCQLGSGRQRTIP